VKRALPLALGLFLGLGVLGALAWIGWGELVGEARPGTVRRMSAVEYERWARDVFKRRHPDGRPLNWRIARVAEQFRRAEPMGRFILNENDCSDFVGCVIDEALGVGARFNRDSDEHILCGEGGRVRRWLFESYRLPNRGVVQPGDIVHVRHSPWYPPTEDSMGHVGVIGPEGQVIDFCKLKSWSKARYGRTDFEWFIHHNELKQVVISRLRPQYRYCLIGVSSSIEGSGGGDGVSAN
jgi:hypothetical protein